MEQIVKKWENELEQVTQQLAQAPKNDDSAQGLQPFITQISGILENKAGHIEEFNRLKSTNSQIESEIQRLKQSIESYKPKLYL